MWSSRSGWHFVSIFYFFYLQIYDVSKDENADIFKAAQVSIGMLGVLTEVTIQAEDLFNLVENRNPHPLSSYCLENLDDLVLNSEYTYVTMWMDFYNDFCILFNTNRTNAPPTPVSPFKPLIDFLTVSHTVHIGA